jgi:hypothetical protein
MRQIGIVVLAAAAATVIGCGSKSAAPAAGDPSPTPSATVAPTPQATAQPAPPEPAVPPVDFERLIALLPDAPAGWTKGKPKGDQTATSRAISRAEADYEKGDSSINLEITDTAFDKTYLAPLSFTLAAHYSERHGSGYAKSEQIGSSPGFEKWDADAKSAEVTVLVGNRIVVTAKGRNVDNVDASRALVLAVDQGKLAALK